MNPDLGKRRMLWRPQSGQVGFEGSDTGCDVGNSGAFQNSADFLSKSLPFGHSLLVEDKEASFYSKFPVRFTRHE
jgi:hypothetical protein